MRDTPGDDDPNEAEPLTNRAAPPPGWDDPEPELECYGTEWLAAAD